MILAIDVGNTNIVVGCIDDRKTYFIERLSTNRTKTELEYAVDLKNVLDIYHIKKTEIEGCIISSVVPQITNIVKLAAEKILKKNAIVLGPGVKTGLNIMMDNPGQFRQKTEEEFGAFYCKDITHLDWGVIMEKCPGLIADTYTKVMEILTEREVLEL